MSNNRLTTIATMLLLTLLGGSLGFGAFYYLKTTRDTQPPFKEAFSLADQRYKEARDLEVEGELTLSRMKYTQARDLFSRQGNQAKLNLANEGIARTLGLAQDYSLDVGALNNLLSSRVQNFHSNEQANWEFKGLFDSRFIDGQKRYFHQSLDNLAMLNPSVAGRVPGWLESKTALAKNLTAYALAQDWGYPLQNYRNPTTFQVRYRLIIDTDQLPSYQKVKCWLPYPVNSPQQFSSLTAFQPAGAIKFSPLAEGDVGTAYAELKNTGKGPLTVELEYQLQTREVNKKIDPNWVGSYDTNSQLYQQYTRSEPHLELSEPINNTARQIVGSETNPALKAHLIYNWVVENIKLQNVSYHLVQGSSASHQALEKMRGDSTLQAFLFTSLCRSQGIPCRVAGGYRLIPGSETPTAWAEFFLPNYGWVPADPGTAQLVCLSSGLSQSDKNRVREYYFGNLDPLRVNFNQTALAPLNPAKQSERNLSLLLLQPELECGGSNLTPDHLSFTLTATRL